MSLGRTPFEKELFLRVDEILHYVWDPINIRDEPAVRDEYSSYVLPIAGLLLSNATASVIAAGLADIETKRMGFDETPQLLEHSMVVAELLFSWKEFLDERHHG